MYRIPGPKQVMLACPNCDSDFMVPVQYDEDGGYAEVETEPCHDDECTKRICSCCPQFACESCGLTQCLEHAIQYGGSLWCRMCIEVEIEDGAFCLGMAS